jgi:hypothetical protein
VHWYDLVLYMVIFFCDVGMQVELSPAGELLFFDGKEK